MCAELCVCRAVCVQSCVCAELCVYRAVCAPCFFICTFCTLVHLGWGFGVYLVLCAVVLDICPPSSCLFLLLLSLRVRIYSQLPEVQRRREEEKRKAEYGAYRLNAQLFNKVRETHIHIHLHLIFINPLLHPLHFNRVKQSLRFSTMLCQAQRRK